MESFSKARMIINKYISDYVVCSSKDHAFKQGLIMACDLLENDIQTKQVYVVARHHRNTKLSDIIGVYNNRDDAYFEYDRYVNVTNGDGILIRYKVHKVKFI